MDGHGRPDEFFGKHSPFPGKDDRFWEMRYEELSSALNYRLGAFVPNLCNPGWRAGDEFVEEPRGGIIGGIIGDVRRPPHPGESGEWVHVGGRDLVSVNGIFPPGGMGPLVPAPISGWIPRWDDVQYGNYEIRPLFYNGRQFTRLQ